MFQTSKLWIFFSSNANTLQGFHQACLHCQKSPFLGRNSILILVAEKNIILAPCSLMFFHWSIVDFGCISYKRPWFLCSFDLGVTHSASVILLIYPNIKAELYIHCCCWVFSGLVLTLSQYQEFCSELMSI